MLKREREPYPSDLTDAEREVLRPLIPGPAKLGRPPRYEKRAILNVIFYVVRSGCSWRMLPGEMPPWRMLPNDLPPWTAVRQQALRWMRAGCFEAMAQDLRAVVRLLQERGDSPAQ